MTQLAIENLAVCVRSRTLLREITLTLGPGDLLAVVGPNGAGKSTLLRTAMGRVLATRGSVRLGGRDVQHIPPRERAGLVAWLPQLLTQTEGYPVLDLVVAARYRFVERRAVSIGAARNALERVGAGSLLRRTITEISGGERQRVALAALLAQEAPLLLLDEPANHLDPAAQLETYQLIGSLREEGMGVLCVTHDVNLLANIASRHAARVVGLADGRLRFELHSDDSQLIDALSELFGTPLRLLRDDQGWAILPTGERPARIRPEPLR